MLKILQRFFDQTTHRNLTKARAYVNDRVFPQNTFTWSPLSRRRNQILKRGLDIGIGFIGTAMSVPAVIVLAPLIKIDSPGPILYAQEREGRHGQPITIYKFRTMRLGADREPLAPTSVTEVYALRERGDPRVSRIGKFLRLYGLDEIPQFWSILKGDMTLLGLRAMPKYELDDLAQEDRFLWRRHRQQVRPSLAAAPFCFLCRHVNDPQDLMMLEMYYLSKWSMLNDIQIMARGLVAIAAGKHI